MPLVSVIIPTYNRSQLLKQAIASVLSQTFADLEIWVVNDGSIDDTGEVVVAIGDPRVHYIYQVNSGLAAARNAGIRQAQGAYVAFLDDDDLWLAEKLERQVALFEQQPDLGLVTCGYQTINGQGVKLSEVRPWTWRPELTLNTWLFSCPTVPSAVMVRRDWLVKAELFDEGISRQACGAEDWDLWLRLAVMGCPMAWTAEILCEYRIHSTSMVHHAARQRSSMLIVLDKLFKRDDLPAGVETAKNDVYSQALLRSAARLCAAGEVELARSDIEQAVGLAPGLLEHDAKGLYQALIGWFGDPIVADPGDYVTKIHQALPPSAFSLERRRRDAFRQAAKAGFLKASKQPARKERWRALGRLALTHPELLVERQVAARAVEILLGEKVKSTLGRWVKGGRELG